jgi:hypothetical protein
MQALHDAARDGCCGFVALRTHAAGADDAASADSVAQLLGCRGAGGLPLAARFRGLRCVAARMFARSLQAESMSVLLRAQRRCAVGRCVRAGSCCGSGRVHAGAAVRRRRRR